MKTMIMRLGALLAGGTAIALALGSAGAGTMVDTNSTAVQTLRKINTVFVIALENHDWVQHNTGKAQQLFDNPAAPYLNSLVTPGNSNATQVSWAPRYYNAAHGEHP